MRLTPSPLLERYGRVKRSGFLGSVLKAPVKAGWWGLKATGRASLGAGRHVLAHRPVGQGIVPNAAYFGGAALPFAAGYGLWRGRHQPPPEPQGPQPQHGHPQWAHPGTTQPHHY